MARSTRDRHLCPAYASNSGDDDGDHVHGQLSAWAYGNVLHTREGLEVCNEVVSSVPDWPLIRTKTRRENDKCHRCQVMGPLVAPKYTTQGGGLHERSIDGSPWRIVGFRSARKMPCNMNAGQPKPNHDHWWIRSGGGDDIVAEPGICASSNDWFSRCSWEPCGRLMAIRSAHGPYRSQRKDTFGNATCGLDVQWRRRSDADCFPKKSAAYGQSSVQHKDHGEMICRRCFRVHSNCPGDAEADGEASLKRASSKG